jgi:hypothetical protein
MQSGASENLQAEIDELREQNKVLSRENTTLKSRVTKLNKQKEAAEKALEDTKQTLETQLRTTDTRTKKLKKAQEQVQLLLEKPCDECERYEKSLEAEEERYQELSDQAIKLKQKIAAASRLDNQVTDETFREAMSCAFVAIKDCFWGVLRKQDFSKNQTQHLVLILLTKLSDITIESTDCLEDLDRYLPSYEDDTRKDKIYLCILAVALPLVRVVNAKKAFGYSKNKLILAATKCYAKIPGKPQKHLACCMESGQETELLSRASKY